MVLLCLGSSALILFTCSLPLLQAVFIKEFMVLKRERQREEEEEEEEEESYLII